MIFSSANLASLLFCDSYFPFWVAVDHCLRIRLNPRLLPDFTIIFRILSVILFAFLLILLILHNKVYLFTWLSYFLAFFPQWAII